MAIGKAGGSYHGVLGAGSYGGTPGVPPVGPDTVIETVADYATMIGSGPVVDTVYVVLDDVGGDSGFSGIAHYTFDLATGNFVLIASQASSLPPFCLIDTDGDTSVCVERLPDEDIIWGQANSIDVLKIEGVTDYKAHIENSLGGSGIPGGIYGFDHGSNELSAFKVIDNGITKSTLICTTEPATGTGLTSQRTTGNSQFSTEGRRQSGNGELARIQLQDGSARLSRSDTGTDLWTAQAGISIPNVSALPGAYVGEITNTQSTGTFAYSTGLNARAAKLASIDTDVTTNRDNFFLVNPAFAEIHVDSAEELRINEGTTGAPGGTGAASVNDVLTLINATTGQSEWTTPAGVAVPIAAWVDNGLHVDTGVIHRGGTLIENTTIDGDNNTYSVDFLEPSAFTVTDTETNISRGDFSVYNEASSPFLGIPGSGSGYTTGTVNVYQHNTALNGGESYINYFDTSTSNQSLIRANSSSATITSNIPGSTQRVEASHGNDRVYLHSASAVVGEETEVTLTPTSINIDVLGNDLFVNEGTTATGTNVAAVGDVLENKTGGTGETKRTTIRYDEALAGEGNNYTVTHNLGVQYPTSIHFFNTVSGTSAIISTKNHVLNSFDLNLPGALTFTGVVTVSK